MAKKVKAAQVEEEIVMQEEEILEDVVTEEVEEEASFNSDEEFLFPDGPTLNQVEEWKSLYKEIYATEFDEDIFIWRTLSRKEYKDIFKIQQADAFYREERICEKCILWPESYNFIAMSGGKAGIPSLLAEQIMDKSGFVAKTGAMRI